MLQTSVVQGYETNKQTKTTATTTDASLGPTMLAMVYYCIMLFLSSLASLVGTGTYSSDQKRTAQRGNESDCGARRCSREMLKDTLLTSSMKTASQESQPAR